MLRLPGRSFRGPLPALTDGEREIADLLRRHVRTLALDIGERHLLLPERLDATVAALRAALGEAGIEPFLHDYGRPGERCLNLEFEVPGRRSSQEVVLVGAHYDTVPGSPGAGDNGSGVAAALAMARAFRDAAPACTVRFVWFAHEEAPYFATRRMGSRACARRCRGRGEDVRMLSLETIGYYSDEPGSQRYPWPLAALYPEQGDFVAFVANLRSRPLLCRAIGSFRRTTRFPSEGAALPAAVPGVSWSDHWAFWQEGYRALMVTDTAPYRYPNYHTSLDLPDRLDFERTARVVAGLCRVVADLAGAEVPAVVAG